LVTRGGQLITGFGDLIGTVIVVLLVIGSYLIARRFQEQVALSAGTVALVIAVASGVLVQSLAILGDADVSSVPPSEPLSIQLSETPDIYFVLLDGYPGQHALSREFGDAKTALTSDLAAKGFQIPKWVWSPYPTTNLAMPAMLDMRYHVESLESAEGVREMLRRIASGDNETVDVLRANGYETMMIESGWSGNSCGPAFDRCVRPPWIDETVFTIGWDGIWGRLLVDYLGHPYTIGSLKTMEELTREAKRAPAAAPRFVFAHIIAPHPPYLLDHECEVQVSDERLRASFAKPAVNERSAAFFLQQTECVDRFMRGFASITEPDDVVIFVGDHGTRRRSALDDGRPDVDGVVDRHNVLLAARVDSSCDLGDTLSTVNLMRRVLSCYSTEPVEELVERIFLPDGHEMSPAEIRRELLATGARGS
jgi:hypothetical protein